MRTPVLLRPSLRYYEFRNDNRPSGRPRDPRIDSAVLTAAADLVQEVGYADLSIAAIAERAGTTKPAIYRRWPSKAHLVHEAVFPSGEPELMPHTGSIAGDVREMLRRTADVWTAPAARAAMPGLMGEIAVDPTLHAALLERFDEGVFGPPRPARRGGRERRGACRRDPAALIETIAGATLMALLIRSTSHLDDAWVERTADLLTKGIRP